MRTFLSFLLCVVLAVPALAGGHPRPAPNTCGDGDSPWVIRRITRVIKAVGHLIVAPFDTPDITWPKP